MSACLPIFAIRPEPGLAATIAAGHQAGLGIEGAALFAIRPVAWSPPEPAGVDGLLLGSANALRHGGRALAVFQGKPAYVVGAATADAARQAGLAIARTGSGGLQQVLDGLEGHKLVLLRLAGAEHVPLRPPQGVTVVERIVYEAIAMPMPPDLAGQLRKGGVVLLHSAGAARHFASECSRLDLPRSTIRLAALGPRIAQAAGGGWAAVAAAADPRESVLLALARDMCH